MSVENRVINYGENQGANWTNKSMSIDVPVGKSHSKIAHVALAASFVFGGYQLANPEKASALQDPIYPQTSQEQLQCEPIIEKGLGTTNGIPPELQGRTTCVNANGGQESVIFYCDQVLNPNIPLGALDGNSTNESPLCYEGPSDINGNGISDYNPIIPDVGAINGLTAPVATFSTSAPAGDQRYTPDAPVIPNTPKPSVGERLVLATAGAVALLFLIFGPRLNAKLNYQAGYEDGRAQGAGADGAEIEDAVKSHPKVKKITKKVRAEEQKKRGIKIPKQ